MSAREDYPMLDFWEREDFKLYVEAYYKKKRAEYVKWGLAEYWKVSKRKRVAPSLFRDLMAKKLLAKDLGLSEALTLCPSEHRRNKYTEMATVIVYGDMFEGGRGPAS